MAKPRKWYRIENAASDEATVYIYEAIVSGDGFFGGVPAKQFVKDLADIQAETIRVRINSPGGDVFSAMSIHGALQRHPARVVAHIDGLAASAATFVALAADEVRMAKGAFFMIHNAHAFAGGDASTMREIADLLERITGSIRDIYVERTGADAAEVQAQMDAETWFTAAEAKEAGFVDVVEDGRSVKSEFDLSIYNRVPDQLRNSASGDAPRKIETIRDFEGFLRDEGGFSRDAAKAIAAAGFKAPAEPRDEAGAVDVAALTQLLTTLRT